MGVFRPDENAGEEHKARHVRKRQMRNKKKENEIDARKHTEVPMGNYGKRKKQKTEYIYVRRKAIKVSLKIPKHIGSHRAFRGTMYFFFLHPRSLDFVLQPAHSHTRRELEA